MATKPITARRRIFLSQLDPKTFQREVMNDDAGWEKFAVKLNALVAIPDISESVIAATINRSVEGASTVELEIDDYSRKLLKSDMLREKLDIEIDGLWFRLTSVDKNGDNLTLTFQDREIEILRTYKSWKIANRNDMTRAEFVLSMIREVKEYNIPVVIPELHKVQPIETYPNSNIGADTIMFKNGGIPKDINKAADQHHHRESQDQYKANPGRLTVKSSVATETQIGNANIILAVADQLGVSQRLKVIAMMVAITETLIKNEPGGPAAHNTKNNTKGNDSAGVFQQRPDWGPYLDRTDVETSTRMFFNGSNGIPGAIQIASEHPDDPYWVVAADIQHPDPRYDARYALYRVEAEKFVSAYGDVGVPVDQANSQNTNQSTYSSSSGAYYFYRGEIADKRGKPVRRPENTWKCIQRLADDVDWRAFFVSGTFYFISEVDLLKQLPLAIISEFTPGIESFNGSYNRHAKNGTIEIEAIAGSWSVPPGGVVLVKDVGHPFDGRWIVSSYQRDLIGTNKRATISLKKPRPALPEVKDDPNAATLAGWVPAIVPVSFTGTVGNFVAPLPTPMGPGSEFEAIDAEGAPDSRKIRHHAGKDWFAPGGTQVVAPIGGTIVEIKQSSGSSGQIFGGVVKLQQFDGYVWVFRHVDPQPALRLGAVVSAGDPIASVVLWADKPKSSHAHIEIWKTLAGGYKYENMVDPILYMKGSGTVTFP